MLWSRGQPVPARNGPTGIARGTPEGMPPLVGALAPGGPFAGPHKRRGMGIPASHLGSQPLHDLAGAFGVLAGQGPPHDDALQGLGQVQPGAGDWGV